MNTRSTRTVMTFPDAFALPGCTEKLPAGQYVVVVEEELLQWLSFEAYRRTATFLEVHGRGGKSGRTELRPIAESDLEKALKPDGH